MPIEMNFPQVTFLQFWLTFALGIAVIVIFGMYMLIFVWWFGKPMRKYLKARLTPGLGIIQEYMHENVFLKLAREQNDEFIDTERKGYTERTELKKRWYHHLMPWLWDKPIYNTVYHAVKPVVAKSVVSINGVKTVLAWNVTPPLPERYIKALEALVANGYGNASDITLKFAQASLRSTADELGYGSQAEIQQDLKSKLITLADKLPGTEVTIEQLMQIVDDPDPAQITPTDMIPGTEMTFTEFLNLHEIIKNKNEIIVTPDDILSFSEKYLDEHAKKSVIEKEVTVAKKRASEKTYQKYAFMIIGAMVLFGFIMLAWKIHSGGT